MKLQSVTGADLLQLDLGELEASRLDGIKQTVPVKRTYSATGVRFSAPVRPTQKNGPVQFYDAEEAISHRLSGILRLSHPRHHALSAQPAGGRRSAAVC